MLHIPACSSTAADGSHPTGRHGLCPRPQRSAYSSLPGNISGIPRKASSRTAAHEQRLMAQRRCLLRAVGHQVGVRLGAGPLEAKRPAHHQVGGAQVGRQLVRRLRRSRLGPLVQDGADQLVAPGAVFVVGGADVGEERRAGPTARSVRPGRRRRRPRRARRRGRSVARRRKSSEHRQVLGDRRRHRGQQLGEGTALGLDRRSDQELLQPSLDCEHLATARGAGVGGPVLTPPSASRCATCMRRRSASSRAQRPGGLTSGDDHAECCLRRSMTASTSTWSASTGGAEVLAGSAGSSGGVGGASADGQRR